MNIEVDQGQFEHLLLKLGQLDAVPEFSRLGRTALYHHMTESGEQPSLKYIQGFWEVGRERLIREYNAHEAHPELVTAHLSEWADWLIQTGRASVVIRCYATKQAREPRSLLIRQQGENQ